MVTGVINCVAPGRHHRRRRLGRRPTRMTDSDDRLGGPTRMIVSDGKSLPRLAVPPPAAPRRPSHRGGRPAAGAVRRRPRPGVLPAPQSRRPRHLCLRVCRSPSLSGSLRVSPGLFECSRGPRGRGRSALTHHGTCWGHDSDRGTCGGHDHGVRWGHDAWGTRPSRDAPGQTVPPGPGARPAAALPARRCRHAPACRERAPVAGWV